MNTDNNTVLSVRKKQGVNLGDGEGINTGNDLDNIMELKNQNPNFKRNIKALKNKVSQEKENNE